MLISKRLIVIAAAALSALSAGFTPLTADGPARVGIVTDGAWEGTERIKQLFIQEIIALTSGDYDVRFPDEMDIRCDYTVDSVQTALNRLLGDRDCDVILALGAIASNEVAGMDALSKPVIAPFIIDPEIQKTPIDGVSSGVRNLSYLTSPFNIRRDVEAFMKYTEFDTLVVFVAAPFAAAIPELNEKVVQATSATGAAVNQVLVGESPRAALDAIPPGTDAVFLAGLVHMAADSFQVLVDGINERKLPSFSLLGKMDVERGVLFGLSPDSTFPTFARRVAVHFQQIMMGVDAGTLPIAFSGGERLTVNMATARRIGIYPNWEVITEAELIDREEKRVVVVWGLRSVMNEALRVNRDVLSSEQVVKAGAQDVNRAVSTLLPQIDLNANALQIDEDRAEASLGSQPGKSVTGGISGTQILWSERAWANLSIQKNVQRSRELDYESVRLEVALEALTSFLNVLRAKTNERIVSENLKLSASNLERARTRHAIGIAGPDEVYRWQSALANNRAAAIDANASRNLAEMQLNRVLYRPLEESFGTEEFGMDDPDILRYQQGVLVYFENPYSFKVLRNFLVEDGLSMSPELKALDAAIAAQQRAFDSSTYAFFSPDLLLYGSIDHWLWEGGAGTGLDGVESPFPQKDDTDWAVGVELRFPLLTSGSRVFDRRQNSEELVRLKTERQALAQRIEQRIRSALHETGAAYANIRQRRDAADAANKNLELIIDAYSQGAVSILNLLDAQNSAFGSASLAADAVYLFLIKLMEVERSIGKFYFFASQEEVDAIGERFDRYLEEHPITLD